MIGTIDRIIDQESYIIRLNSGHKRKVFSKDKYSVGTTVIINGNTIVKRIDTGGDSTYYV